jgi:hypothetical protein
MRYEGAIDYLDVPLGEVDWDSPHDGILSPWKSYTWGLWHTSDDDGGTSEGSVVLKADSRKFQRSPNVEDEYEVFYDAEENIASRSIDVKCVVLGRKRASVNFSMEQTIHYVLLITPKRVKTSDEQGMQTYERIGVGLMAGRYIDLTDSKFVDIE